MTVFLVVAIDMITRGEGESSNVRIWILRGSSTSSSTLLCDSLFSHPRSFPCVLKFQGEVEPRFGGVIDTILFLVDIFDGRPHHPISVGGQLAGGTSTFDKLGNQFFSQYSLVVEEAQQVLLLSGVAVVRGTY